jgi:ribosomal protein S18 acetylase RimI-like enzyme
VSDDPTFAIVDPHDPDAQAALREYLAEVAQHISEPAIGMHEADDVDDFREPRGAFIVARLGTDTVACGALRPFDDDTAEIKRMWVRPASRGRGLAATLLEELERVARQRGFARARLDTNEALTPAIRLYESRGYRRIERFNDNPDATHFYEKHL